MSREPGMSNNESEFIGKLLAVGRRVDLRTLFEPRLLSVTYLRELGHADVRLGHTRCLAAVTAEITVPREEAPNDGILLFNTVFSPMSAPGVETNRLSEDEVFVSRMLDKSLRRSRAVDTEGLCILARQKVWSLRVDIRVLDNGGNVVDCASAAAIAALLHFRKPDVTVRGEEVIIHPADEKPPVPIKLNHAPLCCSFVFFGDGKTCVLDPTYLENKLQVGQLTVAANIHRELCALNMSGGSPLSTRQVTHCTTIACEQAVERTTIIKGALLEDYKQRGISIHTSDIFKKLLVN